MLPDSAHIQESDARRAARRGHGAASEPIYTQRDVAACLAQVQAVDYESDLVPNRTVHCRFRDAGHILGSAIIEVWVSEGDRTIKVVFSGDLGQPGRPIVCRSEEHTSELQSLMRISYAVFCLKKKRIH